MRSHPISSTRHLDEREIHHAWLLYELQARVQELVPKSELVDSGIKDLQKSGTFIRKGVSSLSLLKPFHAPESQALLATLAVALELRDRSKIFLIAGGPAFLDLAASDLSGAHHFIIRSHKSLDFYMLERDVPALLETMDELSIKPTSQVKLSAEETIFQRSSDLQLQNYQLKLSFASESFLPEINFNVLEAGRGDGFVFRTEQEDFIFPEKYLCHPRFYFKPVPAVYGTELPLIDLRIANYIASSEERKYTKSDLTNIRLLHKGLPKEER